MKTKTKHRLGLLALLFAFLCVSNIQAQVTYPFEDWVSTAGSQNFFYKNVTKTYGIDTYVAGATVNDSGNYDILLIKYNSAGAVAWTKQYNGAGNGLDMATDLLVDANGVFLVGTTYKNSTNNQDAIIIKYNTSGTQQWIKTYNGTGSSYDGFTSLCTDGTYIYTSGGSFGSSNNSDYVVLSYKISDGTQMWASRYNSTYDLHDLPSKITYNSTFGITYRITVSGGMQYTSTNWKFGTVTYNTSGTMGTATLSGTNSDGLVRVTDITTDASGNTYVIGAIQNSGQYDWRTIKLNTSLTESWAVEYEGGSNLEDSPLAIKEKSGYLYVTGFATVTGQGRNIVTKKYNASNGATVWTQTYNGSTNGNDEGGALVIDGSTNIYVGGTTNNGSNSDFITTKYNSSGTQQWQMTYNSIANTDDKISDIALNGTDVIVTGQSGVGASLSYLTVKYAQKSLIIPPDPEPANHAFSYVENRDQLLNTSGAAIPSIKFYNKTKTPNIYIADSSISYVVGKLDTNAATYDTLQRIDIKFTKRNTNEKVRPMNKKGDFINYYLANASREQVPQYGLLVYPAIISNIDMYMGSNSKGHKIYFVCKPGFTLADIELEFTGQTGISINGGGDLVLATVLGNITHPKAKVYQINGSGAYVSLGWQPSYSLTSNKIKFNSLGTYNTAQPLVFEINLGPNDPPQTTMNGNLDWSTMYGGDNLFDAILGDDRALDITVSEHNGVPFMAGRFGSSNMPALSGLQSVNGQYTGSYDGFIQAFKVNAEPKWLTIIGGTKQERINSVALGRGYLFGVGGTNSTNLNVLPSSLSGAYNDNAKSTNNDAFIIKLDTLAGARQWVSYFGGRGFDEAKSITPERTGYMFIVGETTSTDASSSCTPQSDGSFTTCNPGGAAYYQASNNGGREVFLLRIGPNDNLLYSSFFGSNQNDYVYETKMYFSDYYFVGSTKRNSDTTLAYTACTGSISGNFPLCNFQSSSNYFSAGGPASLDSTVSYIATLNDSLALRWCTNVNYVSELQTITAIENYIYTAGITNQAGTAVSKCVPDNDSLSVCHPLVSDSSSANGYVYLMKFAVPTNHSLTWSTLVPYLDDTKLLSAPTALIAEPEEKFLDLAVDQANNLYVAAFSNYLYLNVLPSTLSGMYYQDLKGNVIGDTVFADAVLMSYDNMNRKSWESYFGGGLQYSTINNVLVQPMYCDAPSALATYGNQYLYFAGYSGGSSSFPYMDYNSSSSLDYYQEHQGFDYDAFVSRFSLKSIGVGIQEMEQPDKNGVVLFPNPATNIIYLSDTKFDGEGVSIKVLDITGRVVIDETRKSTSSLIDIDVSSLSSGTYIVQLLSDKFSYSGKFVKQW